jgi:hypothetical protein
MNNGNMLNDLLQDRRQAQQDRAEQARHLARQIAQQHLTELMQRGALLQRSATSQQRAQHVAPTGVSRDGGNAPCPVVDPDRRWRERNRQQFERSVVALQQTRTLAERAHHQLLATIEQDHANDDANHAALRLVRPLTGAHNALAAEVARLERYRQDLGQERDQAAALMRTRRPADPLAAALWDRQREVLKSRIKTLERQMAALDTQCEAARDDLARTRKTIARYETILHPDGAPNRAATRAHRANSGR